MRTTHPRIQIFAVASLFTLAACSRSKSDGSDGGSSLISELASDLGLNKATGHVTSTGSTESWQLDSGDCYSGDKDGYYGIFVKSKADKRVWVKLVKDPTKGWNVGVSTPSTCKALPNSEQCDVTYFSAQECKTLDVGLQAYTFTGKNATGQHQFDGNVSFDCTGSKAHVAGTLKIEKCSP